MKLDTRTRTATLLAASGALLTAFNATALAAHASEPVLWHDIDTDVVDVSTDSGRVHGVTYETVHEGYVQISLHATTERASALRGCVSTRVTYIYADSTFGMQDSPRVCDKGTSYSTVVDTQFRSSATRDIVRYAVQLMAASGPTTTPTVQSTTTQFIGDAPDSLGTSARLDRDQLAPDWSDGHSFRGTADFAITAVATSNGTARNVTGQISGVYTWPTYTGFGDSFRDVYIVWNYADGSNSVSNLGRIYAGMAPRKVLAASDPRRDVVSFDAGIGYSWGYPKLTYFGDEQG